MAWRKVIEMLAHEPGIRSTAARECKTSSRPSEREINNRICRSQERTADIQSPGHGMVP